MHATLFPYVWRHDEQCHGADARPGESSPSRCVVVRPVLVQERLRGGGVVVGRPAASAGRFEGAINGASVRDTVAVMAMSCCNARVFSHK
jgi:hypothetical protein